MNRTSLVVLTAVLGLPLGAAIAAAPAVPAAFADTKTAEGTIKSVGGDSFVLTHDGKDTTVKLTKDTTYALDGKPSTKDAVLKVGYKVKATHMDGTASKVESWVKK